MLNIKPVLKKRLFITASIVCLTAGGIIFFEYTIISIILITIGMGLGWYNIIRKKSITVDKKSVVDIRDKSDNRNIEMSESEKQQIISDNKKKRFYIDSDK